MKILPGVSRRFMFWIREIRCFAAILRLRKQILPEQNLELIAKGTRDDGLLELTYPSVDGPAIPFFSVMYPVEVYEYIKYTGDKSILETTMPTMLGIMKNFKSRIEKNHLIRSFNAPYWNFLMD